MLELYLTMTKSQTTNFKHFLSYIIFFSPLSLFFLPIGKSVKWFWNSGLNSTKNNHNYLDTWYSYFKPDFTFHSYIFYWNFWILCLAWWSKIAEFVCLNGLFPFIVNLKHNKKIYSHAWQILMSKSEMWVQMNRHDG